MFTKVNELFKYIPNKTFLMFDNPGRPMAVEGPGAPQTPSYGPGYNLYIDMPGMIMHLKCF